MAKSGKTTQVSWGSIALWVALIAFSIALYAWMNSPAGGPRLVDWGAIGLQLLFGGLAVLALPVVVLLALWGVRLRLLVRLRALQYDEALRLAKLGLAAASRCFGNAMAKASWLNSLATVHLKREEYGPAALALQEQAAILEGQSQEDQHGPHYPDCLVQLASALTPLGRSEEAETTLRRALATYSERSLPPTHVLAWALEQLAQLRVEAHDFGEAETLARRALGIRESLLPEGGVVLESRRGQLAELLRKIGRREEAQALARRTLSAVEERTQPLDPLRCGYMALVARTLEDCGEVEEAESLYQRALEIAKAANHPDGERIAGHLARLRGEPVEGSETPLGSARRRADALESAGNLEAAVLFLQGALAQAPAGREKADALGHLGQLERASGRFQPALAAFDQALAMPEAAQDAKLRSTLLNNRAFVLLAAGDVAEAEKGFRQTLSHLETTLGPSDFENATVLNNLAGTLARQGRHAEAARVYEKALPMFQAAVPVTDERWLKLLENMASCYREAGEVEPEVEIEARLARARAARELN